MHNRRDFLKKAASLSMLGMFPVAGAMAASTKTSNMKFDNAVKRVDELTSVPQTIVKFCYRNSAVKELLHKINTCQWINDRTQAFTDLAQLAEPVINFEIEKALDSMFPYNVFSCFTKTYINAGSMPGFHPLSIPESMDTLDRECRNDWDAYYLPGGYIAKRYMVTLPSSEPGHDVTIPDFCNATVKSNYYRLGLSVPWNPTGECYLDTTLHGVLSTFVNSIVDKMHSDAMILLLASAFCKNSVAYCQVPGFPLCTIEEMVNGNATGLTDLYVGPEIYNELMNIDTGIIIPGGYYKTAHLCLYPNSPKTQINLTVHYTPELDVDGGWMQYINGSGLVLPPRTKHLILGINRTKTEFNRLFKQKMCFQADDPGYTLPDGRHIVDKHPAGFFGWMNMSLCCLTNTHVQLGAI